VSTSRPPSRRREAAPAPAADKPSLGGADLLKAGLKAIEEVRGEVASRHSRFFEALLGIEAGKRKAKELFALPTFEDLFDERVARSLDRLGIAQALAELREQIAALDERVRRLEKPQPSRKPRSRP